MSGITPLLDTLLHQVLGRRVDIPLPKDLNPAVAASVPVQGARPLHSDSRLETHAPEAQARALEAAQAESSGDARGSRAAVAGRAAAPPPASTTITLSGAARAIAELLQRFPAPPSSIAPGAALLDLADLRQPPVAQIAARLQDSIRLSGLFFESHVARWFEGKLPLEALRQEPQMRGVPLQSQIGAAPPAAIAQPAEAGVTGRPGLVSVVPEQVPPARPADSPALPVDAERDAAPQLASGAAGTGEAPALESPAALLRHQLELLATPQLRWEGEVWAGLFMAMTIEPPAAQARERGEGGADAADGEDEWCVRLRLDLVGQGALEVVVALRGQQLALTLQTDSPRLRGYFAAAGEELRGALLRHGFAVVNVRMVETGEAHG